MFLVTGLKSRACLGLVLDATAENARENEDKQEGSPKETEFGGSLSRERDLCP